MTRTDWTPQTIMVAVLCLLLCTFAIAGFLLGKLDANWVLGIFVGVVSLWSPSPLQIPIIGGLHATAIESNTTATLTARDDLDDQWLTLNRRLYAAQIRKWQAAMDAWTTQNSGIGAIPPGTGDPPPQPPPPIRVPRGPASGPAAGWKPLPAVKVDPHAGQMFN